MHFALLFQSIAAHCNQLHVFGTLFILGTLKTIAIVMITVFGPSCCDGTNQSLGMAHRQLQQSMGRYESLAVYPKTAYATRKSVVISQTVAETTE
jgi:hypothetical protein